MNKELQDLHYTGYAWGTVVRVIDGDTIDVRFQLKMQTYTVRRCRLLDVDTYETRGRFRNLGYKAKDELAQLILGKEYWIHFDGLCSFGRVLISFYVEPNLKISDWLKIMGHHEVKP